MFHHTDKKTTGDAFFGHRPVVPFTVLPQTSTT
jgi:hypothetical protein